VGCWACDEGCKTEDIFNCFTKNITS
jgi:hypothetical protein